VREWLLNRHKYGMYEKLVKHLRQVDVKSFRNFVTIDPDMFNQMDFRKKLTAESLCELDSSWRSL